jgi:hypothetical protein
LENAIKNWPWGIGLAAGGAAITLMYLGEGVPSMEGQHWVMLLVILVVGYVLGRLWAQPAQMLGLP